MHQGVANSIPNSESNQLPASSKGLLVLVVVMGIMIVIGTGALLWVIVHRMMHPHAVSEQSLPQAVNTVTPPISGNPALLAISRHGDEQIRSVVPRADGTLAVTLVSSQGDGRIVVWLPEQARIIAEFDLRTLRP